MIAILLIPLSIYFAFAFISFIYALCKTTKATNQTFSSKWIGVKLCIKWFSLLWIGLFVELLGILISPVVILFANHETGRLPKAFAWMETHDAILPGYPPEQGFSIPYPASWWGYYWQSLCWLNRNRVYRFTTEYMGVLCKENAARKHIGDYDISDESPVKLGEFIEVSANCFEIQKVFNAFGRVWEWRIGYKMAWTSGKTAYAQHVLRLRSGSKQE